MQVNVIQFSLKQCFPAGVCGPLGVPVVIAGAPWGEEQSWDNEMVLQTNDSGDKHTQRKKSKKRKMTWYVKQWLDSAVQFEGHKGHINCVPKFLLEETCEPVLKEDKGKGSKMHRALIHCQVRKQVTELQRQHWQLIRYQLPNAKLVRRL